MGDAQVVVELQRQLEKLLSDCPPDADKSMDLLKQLDKLKIDFKILKDTKVGKTIQRLKKATQDPNVKKKSQDIIAEWKKLAEASSHAGNTLSTQNSRSTVSPALKKEGQVQSPAVKQKSPTPTPAPANASAPSPTPTLTPAVEKKEIKPNNTITPTASQSFAMKRRLSVEVAGIVKTGNGVRDTCRTMLGNALLTDENAGQYDIGKLASELETAIYNVHPQVDTKYKNLVRSRRSNLQDPKNHDLRLRVLQGDVTPKQLATMTTQELANKDIQHEIEAAKKEAEMNAQIGNVANRTQTSQFQCGKCKKNDTSFFQMQTRSADEPMTTFVTCNVCNNKWKFC
eukprot:CFRG5366T1